MVYSKTKVMAGDPGTAVLENHVQTQYDEVVTDMAAGTIPVAAAALTGTINSARLPSVTRSIFLSAGGGTPTTTSGCAPPAKLELPTNDIMLVSLDYATGEYATFMFAMPDGYAGGTITPVFYWTAASGSGTVIWGIQGRSLDDDEALDQALGTAVTATDTLITANDVHKIAGSAFTLAGTPAGGELAVIKVYRSGGTLAVDAKLIGVKLEFSSTYSD